jgi:hypothetical protein
LRLPSVLRNCRRLILRRNIFVPLFSLLHA